VAAYLERSRSNVYRMLKEWKVLPYVKKGRRYFVRKSDLEAYTKGNRRAYEEFLAWRKEKGLVPTHLTGARQWHEDWIVWLSEREGKDE
jgi:excisionase family DNA binding protein